MTRRLIVLLVLRVLGIYWAVEAATYLLGLVVVLPAWSRGSSSVEEATGLAAAQVSVFIAAFLRGSVALACLVNAGWLARKFFAEFDDQAVALPVRGLGKLAFQLLGVGTILSAAPSIVTAAIETLWGLGGARRATFIAALVQGRWATYLQSLAIVLAGFVVYANAVRLAGVAREAPAVQTVDAGQ